MPTARQQRNPAGESPQATTPASWRDILPIHPAADALPLISAEALAELAADIKLNGLLQPPTLWHDIEEDRVYLLDGRNRLDAMELLNIGFLRLEYGRLSWRLPPAPNTDTNGPEPFWHRLQPLVVDSAIDHPTVKASGKSGALSNTRTYIDAASLVIAANLMRRHLPPGELARLALEIRATTPTKAPVETATNVGVSLGGRGKTGEASEIAKQIGVSVRTVEREIDKARREAAPKYNSEAYKLQREKQAKAEATRKAKRDAEQAENEKAEQKRIARLDAQREALRQRLLTYCQRQIDLGADARLNVLNWLTTRALEGYGEARQKTAEDFMRSATADAEPTPKPARVTSADTPATCSPRCTDGPGHTDWCEFAKAAS